MSAESAPPVLPAVPTYPGAALRAVLPGWWGVDTNERITDALARTLKRAGAAFVMRYVWRENHNTYDLTAAEIRTILAAGLGVGCVQHVAATDDNGGSWRPTAEKGDAYGITAVVHARGLGLPAQTRLWLDLEAVDPSTGAAETVAYCRHWSAAVRGAGYRAGLYVGAGCGLTPPALWLLPFDAYWRGLGVGDREGPITRGFQMRQKPCSVLPGTLAGDERFQLDVVNADALGGLPSVLAPAGWPS